MTDAIGLASYAQVRAALLNKQEIALLDVREEDPHAQAHPLFAANFPLGRIELEAYAKLPRRNAPIVTLDDDGGGDALRAARVLRQLGYSDVRVFDGGVAGWAAAGGELFRDVNVPSKAFGELVEARHHTPSLAAEEVQALIDAGADILIVDARRFDEYQTMSIPTATSVPGGELALRVPALLTSPDTQVIVNCAGRTRSIIGAQSLINAGLANPVAALRNGTIGWQLAGQTLEHGQQRRFADDLPASREASAQRAAALAHRAGVGRIDAATLAAWAADANRTLYRFDVRTPEEYAAGHLPGFRSTPGGQLVQETEMVAPVRGARIVLTDSDGVRAPMTASWLAQMGWDVHVLDTPDPASLSERGPWRAPLPPRPATPTLPVNTLASKLAAGETIHVLDLTTSANYRKAHIPGAWFTLRSQLAAAVTALPPANVWVLTCASSALAYFAVDELRALVGERVAVLEGGTQAWLAAGHPAEHGDTRLASPMIDRYRRPYEGADNPREAMQGYLDWEFGLVEQLGRDGTHGFFVV